MIKVVDLNKIPIDDIFSYTSAAICKIILNKINSVKNQNIESI